MAKLTGRMVIGFDRVAGTGRAFTVVDPRTGDRLEPEYRYGDGADVDRDDAAAMEYLVPGWTFDPKRPCLVRK